MNPTVESKYRLKKWLTLGKGENANWLHRGACDGKKYFETYKQFYVESLKKNKIQFILETSKNDETITELILDRSCIQKKRFNEILVKISLLNNCEDLK